MMLTVAIIEDLFYSHPRKKINREKETTPKLCSNDNPQITQLTTLPK